MPAHQPQFSPEDLATFAAARIAALKVGFKFTPAQEKNWPALETALREQANARAARIAEWCEKAKGPRGHCSVIEELQQALNASRRALPSWKNSPMRQSLSMTVLTTRKKGASGRFYTSPPEEIGITDMKAFIKAKISMRIGMPSAASNKLSTHNIGELPRNFYEAERKHLRACFQPLRASAQKARDGFPAAQQNRRTSADMLLGREAGASIEELTFRNPLSRDNPTATCQQTAASCRAIFSLS